MILETLLVAALFEATVGLSLPKRKPLKDPKMVGDRHPIYFDILQHPVTFLQNKIKTKTSTYNLLSLRFIFIRLAHTTYYLYALFSFIYNAVNVLSFIYSTKKVKEIDKRSKTFKGF